MFTGAEVGRTAGDLRLITRSVKIFKIKNQNFMSLVPKRTSFLKKNERLKNAKLIFCEFQIEILQVEKKRNFEIRKN